jgi:tRNA pseudouridine38-40 synthase
MHTWKLEIEYEGTRYRGWQMQQNARTVQDELIYAAEEAFQMRVELSGAGRTDAGVHALRQVAHLRINKELEYDVRPRQLQFKLNDLLPHDINVTRVTNANDDFNSRRDATSRWYMYQIATRRTAFGKNFVWWIKDELNSQWMNQAAKIIVGRHDFRNYSEVEDSKESTIVHVQHAEVFVDGDMICFRIGASHFLWKMVRRLVGILAEIGRGKLSPNAIETFLTTPNPLVAKLTAPPSGLFLEKVCYRGDSIPTEQKALFKI